MLEITFVTQWMSTLWSIIAKWTVLKTPQVPKAEVSNCLCWGLLGDALIKKLSIKAKKNPFKAKKKTFGEKFKIQGFYS